MLKERLVARTAGVSILARGNPWQEELGKLLMAGRSNEWCLCYKQGTMNGELMVFVIGD